MIPEKLLFRYLNAHLYLGLYDKVANLLKTHKIDIETCNEDYSTSMTLLENELIRLRHETTMGQYDIQVMLHEQINNKPQIFIDLSHYHAKYRRDDLFKIRPCQVRRIFLFYFLH